MRVLAIPGSIRNDSYNRQLLLAARELFPADVEFEIYDELKAVPPYDEDDDVEPARGAVAHRPAASAGADALLFATPEYNSSIPGQLKNAVDWASRPLATNVLRNMPVVVVGASMGAFGAVWAQAELRKVLAATGARVVDAEVAVGHAHERFDETGRLTDENALGELAETVEALVAATRTRELARAA
jgi:chromate reductase